VVVDERAVRCARVRGAAEILASTRLYVACEGRLVAVVAPECADAALAALRRTRLAPRPRSSGREADPPTLVLSRPSSAAPASSTC